jgi:Mg/Co/Ni transporter MgtE
MTQNPPILEFQDLRAQLANYLSVPATAQALTELDLEQRILALQILGESLAALILRDLSPADQAELLQGMEAFELMGVLTSMEPEQRHRLCANLPTDVVDQLMVNLNQEFEVSRQWLLGYTLPSSAAGVDQTDCNYPDWWEIDDCGD